MPQTSSKPLRTGVIGFGYVGRVFHLPYIEATEGLALHAICSSRGDDVRQSYPDVKIFDTAEALCADDALDIVVIAAPNETHRPLAEMALRAGKHVVIDKPFTTNLPDAEAVLQTARETGKHVIVFQNRRWDSDFLAISDVVRSGVLGPIRHVESAFDVFEPTVSDNWRFAKGEGTGRWFDLAPHLVDQALLLFGAPTHVTAEIQCLRAEAGADDWFMVTLHYSQLNVVLRGSMLARFPAPRFVIHGTRGGAIKNGMDIQEAQLVRHISPTDDAFGIDPDPIRLRHEDGAMREVAAPRGCHRQFYTLLVQTLHRKGPLFITEDQMLTVMRIIETAARAAREGRSLKLALPEAARRNLKAHSIYENV